MVLQRKSPFTFIIFSTIIFVLIHHGRSVQFYKEIGFKGPLSYNTTVEDLYDDSYYNPPTTMCAFFEPQHGYPSSLKTTECLVLYEREDCSSSRNSHSKKYSFSARIPPGDYPNLPKFLQSIHFPCVPWSFRTCVDYDRVYGDRYNATVELHDGIYYEDHILLTMTNVCGCLNLPAWTYGRVRAITSRQYCFTLFTEPYCQGKSVKIPPGFNDASEDLRRLSFNGLAKSLNTCEEMHSCHDRQENGTITGYWYNIGSGRCRPDETFSIPLSHLEDEKFGYGNSSSVIAISSPLNATCENSANFTCSKTCGGVLDTKRGAISYKLTESLESFERCVWIVRPYSNKSRFEVNLIWSGFKHVRGKAEVLVAGYGMENERNNGEFENRFRTQRINHTTNWLIIEGPLLLITFYTDELETGMDSKGFMLEYSTVMDSPDYLVSPFSSDYKLEFGEYLIYPPPFATGEVLQTTYSNYELSTFLFYRNHKDELRSGPKRYFLDISQISLGSSTAIPGDHIMVHYFREADWINQGYRMSGWNDPERVSNDDMILLVFKSYWMTPGQGFYLYSSVDDSVVCHVNRASSPRMENRGWTRCDGECWLEYIQ